ncbi:hypothetical protein BH23PLA1_BH23PLA1_15940 [soil metagenome]
MEAEQAIFTSLERDGRSGYHLAARSPGLQEAEAVALAAWSPSHGALLLDEANQSSLNFHPLPGGRLALARTCQGPAEYSGRGGRQLYTHALILDPRWLPSEGAGPFDLYRDAMSRGCFRYRPNPPAILEPIPLARVFRPASPERWSPRARELGVPDPDLIRNRLLAGRDVVLRYSGNRIELAECLLGFIESGASPISFSTSLRPSPTRPYLLSLVD